MLQIETVNKEEGRAHKKKEQSQRSELKEYVYGQTHKCRENLAQTPYNWENGAPVHLSRLWTATPVEIQNPNGQNCRTRRSQGKVSTGAKRAPTNRSKGGQKRKLHQTKGHRDHAKGCDLVASGGEGRKESMSDFVQCIRGGVACSESIIPLFSMARRQGSPFQSFQPGDVACCIPCMTAHRMQVACDSTRALSIRPFAGCV